MAGFLGLPQQTLDYIGTKVDKSISGYQSLMKEFVCENIAMGITSTRKTKLIADTLIDVQRYGEVGSLYECYKALESITLTPEMAPFLTEARLHYLKNRIVEVLATL